MNIETRTILSVTEANQNFSRAAKIADTYGRAVIFKNNKPKYILAPADEEMFFDLTDDEKIDIVAKRVLKKYKDAFLELAK
ncbi:MAG: type II toxin-antitoxin system Phd/YefM family antitoxin [Oscillospiraceae bacterium]|nr:type II toxin-antitoxin system Phd/YefM family antitoxin [Oscillospiraceae bacterium]